MTTNEFRYNPNVRQGKTAMTVGELHRHYCEQELRDMIAALADRIVEQANTDMPRENMTWRVCSINPRTGDVVFSLDRDGRQYMVVKASGDGVWEAIEIRANRRPLDDEDTAARMIAAVNVWLGPIGVDDVVTITPLSRALFRVVATSDVEPDFIRVAPLSPIDHRAPFWHSITYVRRPQHVDPTTNTIRPPRRP